MQTYPSLHIYYHIATETIKMDLDGFSSIYRYDATTVEQNIAMY